MSHLTTASPSTPLSTPPLSTLDPKPFDLTPMNPKRRLLDRDFDLPPLGAYDPVWPADLELPPLPFQDESLNLAVSCVRKYLEQGEEAEWFHVMVRAVAFPAFLEAMDADEGRSRTLPFSCWCDGGTPAEPSHRQHRHMIVVSSPRGHFVKNVWKKTRVDRHLLPRPNFRCVRLETIRDAMHLVNAIGYVSNRKSQCTFSRDCQKGKVKDNHFYLFESLPRDYRLPLVLQWDGGLLQLLDQEHKNTKRIELVRSPLVLVHSRYRLRIEDIPGIELDTVLPVSRDFRPCSHPTPHHLHLIGGRKIHFESHPPLLLLDPEAWHQTQADLGNLFRRAAGKEFWTPRPYQQGLVREFRPLVVRIGELEAESARDREKMERENARLREECRASEREVKSLLNERGEFYREENARLKRENEELKLFVNSILRGDPAKKVKP